MAWRQRRIAGALLAAGFAILVIGWSEGVKACIGGRYQQHDLAINNDPATTVFVTFVLEQWRWWLIKCPEIFFEGHDEAIVALSALATALFTFFLVITSNRQWISSKAQIAAAIAAANAADKSANALPNIERAYVFMGGPCVLLPLPTNSLQRSFEFQTDIDNLGKTPGYVDRLFVRAFSRDVPLNPSPDYTGPHRYGVWVPPGEKGRKIPELFRSVDGISNPGVYGRVWYFDIFDNEHSFGFVFAIKNDPKDPHNSRITPHWEEAPRAYSAGTNWEKHV